VHRVTVKTSTIFIAKGGRTRVYRSVNDVPTRLRKELEASTNGFNSATILIADRRGRQELIRALTGLPSELRSRLAGTLTPAQAEVQPPTRSVRVKSFVRRNWLEMVLPGAVGLVLWLAFNYR
jgi:hypothetical protein